jgi:calcineurin-like phosphoesterase family protein
MRFSAARATSAALTLALLIGLLGVESGYSRPAAAQCSPRSPIVARVDPQSDGTLVATITAGAGNLSAVTFGATNAVFLNGGTVVPSANTAYAVGAPLITFVFASAGAGTAVTVPLTAYDDCGAWPTFVGGGPSATTNLPGASTVVAVGDIACDPANASFNGGVGTAAECRQSATVQLAASMNPAAVLTLGDNQYEDGSLAHYQASYALSWGALKNVTRPVPGNHEYLSGNASGYFAYFGASAGSSAKGYYASSVTGWRLLALNSNCGAIGGCQVGSPQEVWLRAELAAHPNDCILAYWHHPRFSSGLHGNDPTYDAFWQALYDYRADLVLNGHDHVYERMAPQDPTGQPNANGIRAFVVGTGGRNLPGFGVSVPTSEARISQFGVLKLTLQPSSYAWQFVAVDGQGVQDSGSGTCHPSAGAVADPPVAAGQHFTNPAAASTDSSMHSHSRKVKQPRSKKRS